MCYKKTAQNEFEKNKFLCEKIETEYIRKRADNCLEWFIYKAVKNKHYFYILSALTIICPVASEIVIRLPEEMIDIKLVTSIILGISTVAASFLTLFDVHRKWGIYRNQAEGMKRLLSLYDKGEDEENELKSQSVDQQKAERERQLLIKLEEGMNITHEIWMEKFNNKSSNK